MAKGTSDSHKFDPDSRKIRDAAERLPNAKGAKTNDACNPVPRATGWIPAKPTKARKNF